MSRLTISMVAFAASGIIRAAGLLAFVLYRRRVAVGLLVAVLACCAATAEAGTVYPPLYWHYLNSDPPIVSEYDFPQGAGGTVRLELPPGGWLERDGLFYGPDDAYRLAYWTVAEPQGPFYRPIYHAVLEYQRPIAPGVWPGLPIAVPPQVDELPEPFVWRYRRDPDNGPLHYPYRPFVVSLVDPDTIRLAQVPEPAGLVLAILAAVGLAAFRFYRRRAAGDKNGSGQKRGQKRVRTAL